MALVIEIEEVPEPPPEVGVLSSPDFDIDVGGSVDVAVAEAYLPTQQSITFAVTGGVPAIQFPGTPGVGYLIESSQTLTGSWASEDELISDDSNANLSFDDDDAPTGANFYRIRPVVPALPALP